jgi:hypothetical protein
MSSDEGTLDSIRTLIDRSEAARGRFGSTYGLHDLDEAVDSWDVLLRHPDLPRLPTLVRSRVFSNGGHLHLHRYLITRVPEDLDSALRCWEGAFEPLEQAINDGDAEPAELPVLLASMAGALEERYARGGSIDDLMATLSMWSRTPPTGGRRRQGGVNLQSVLDQLAHHDRRQRDLAADELGDLLRTGALDQADTERTAAHLVTTAVHDADPAVRESALHAIVEAFNHRALPLRLFDALRHQLTSLEPALLDHPRPRRTSRHRGVPPPPQPRRPQPRNRRARRATRAQKLEQHIHRS